MSNQETTTPVLLTEQLVFHEQNNEPKEQLPSIPLHNDDLKVENDDSIKDNKIYQEETSPNEHPQMNDKDKKKKKTDDDNISSCSKEEKIEENASLNKKESCDVIIEKKEVVKDELHKELQNDGNKKSLNTKPLKSFDKKNEEKSKTLPTKPKQMKTNNNLNKSTNNIKNRDETPTNNNKKGSTKSVIPSKYNPCVTEINSKTNFSLQKVKLDTKENKERHKTPVQQNKTKDISIIKKNPCLSAKDKEFLSRQEQYLTKKKENQDKRQKEKESKIDQPKMNKNKATKEDVLAKMDNFKEYEKKKQEKLEKLKKEKEDKEKKELEEYKNYLKPKQKVNIEESIHRMTHDEVKKRSEARKVLKDIYKPTFKPTTNVPLGPQTTSLSDKKRQTIANTHRSPIKQFDDDTRINDEDLEFQKQSMILRVKLFKNTGNKDINKSTDM